MSAICEITGGLFTVNIKVSLLHPLNLTAVLGPFLGTAEHPQLALTQVVTLNAQHFQG